MMQPDNYNVKALLRLNRSAFLCTIGSLQKLFSEI